MLVFFFFFGGEVYAGFLYALDEINYIVSCSIYFCCNSWMKELVTSKLFCRTS